MRGSISAAAPLILASWSNPATVSFSVTCINNAGGAYLGEASIPVVTTSITTPYVEFGFLSFLGIGALNLKAQHQEVNFGE